LEHHRDGLDPEKRKGQAFGPGEYFSKEPSTSVAHCRDGKEILVFVVQLPLPKCKDKENDSTSTTRKYWHCPWDYVVVNDNARQLPIGYFEYTAVDRLVMRKANLQFWQLQTLSRQVHLKTVAAKEVTAKKDIIQNLIRSNIDKASVLYKKYSTILSELSKQEISMFAHGQRIDKDFIDYYFEGLPEPLSAEEHSKATIPSMETVVSAAMDARTKFEEVRVRVQQKRGVDQISNTATSTAPWAGVQS
jgi:hypothetical protein